MAARRWRMPLASKDSIRELSCETGMAPFLCSVLLSRGITDGKRAGEFMSDSSRLDSPYGLKDMDAAVSRVRAAIEGGERIAVYGDYDCDGVTSTALLTSYLQSVGADVIYYIPNREKEGYGLNKGAVDILRGQGTSLIITVDNGVSAHSEVDYAGTLGIDVVVTDHHTTRETLPNAAAVVNPRRADCPSRFKGLAGVGVAFKLVCALEEASCEELLEYYSELVALGTIADAAPLTGENRAIVRHGLNRMPETGNAGIRALITESGLGGRLITAESAAFGIVPRINASGRMGVADDAVELLLTDDDGYAEELAGKLSGLNSLRKKIEDEIVSDITRKLEREPGILNRRILVLGGEGWSHGVIGIAAAKLMEKYSKPVLLFSIENGIARGSGRSLEGFSLIEAISSCSEKLISYGGHTLAAGLSLNSGDLDSFGDEIEAYAALKCPDMPVAEYRVDHILEPDELALSSARDLAALEPFGEGNERPLFLLSGIKVVGIYPTSDGKHVRIRLEYGNHLFYAVYFGVKEKELPCAAGDTADALAYLSVSEYNGAPQLSVRIKDVRPFGVDQEALISSNNRYLRHIRGEYGGIQKGEVAPDREDIAAVYRHIRNSGPLKGGYEDMYYRLMGSGIDFCRMRVAADVLMEMKLIARGSEGIGLIDGAERVNLENSLILSALRE